MPVPKVSKQRINKHSTGDGVKLVKSLGKLENGGGQVLAHGSSQENFEIAMVGSHTGFSLHSRGNSSTSVATGIHLTIKPPDVY